MDFVEDFLETLFFVFPKTSGYPKMLCPSMELSGDSIAADFPRGPAVPWRRGGFQKLGWSDISITQSAAAETN